MSTEVSPSFGVLLRRFRRAAGLSQEALAERAGLSVRAVRALERGERRAPYPHTVGQLARALRLSPADRARLAGTLPPRADPEAPAQPELGPAPALPLALTSFVGRAGELAEARRLLNGTRLLTLTGAGGVGKTRLALEVARAAVGDYPGGVWLVELAALADAALLPATVARALGVPERPGRSPTEALRAWLAGRRALLVLDNCEHLIDAGAALAAGLLAACPDLCLLATSREPLAVGGETTWRVPSLAAPAPGQARAAVARSEAGRLFMDRAAAALPGWRLTDANAAAVAVLCRAVDGIPLALELAAARLRALPVEQLAARLGDGIGLLTGGGRAAPPRQRTLRATIDWSYDLLDEPERALLRRLAVFAGGFTLEAVEGAGAGENAGGDDAIELLTRLVDRSLVQMSPGAGGTARYRLLEPVRQYAREKLAEAGEERALRARHAAWFLALVERAEPAVVGGDDQVAWLDQLDAERDNLRAALAWSAEESPAVGLRLAGSLAPFWRVRRHVAEGRGWLERLLARLPAPTAARAKALHGTGSMAIVQGDWGAARARLEEGVALSRALAERRLLGPTLVDLGLLFSFIGDDGPARAALQEAIAVARAVGDQGLLGAALLHLGTLAEAAGDYRRARALGDESLVLLRPGGWRYPMIGALELLGKVALAEGDAARAQSFFDEGLEVADALDTPRKRVELRCSQGDLAGWRGDLERAGRWYEAGLALAREAEERFGLAMALVGLGRVTLRRGDGGRATTLLEESLALATELGSRPGVGRALHALGLAAWTRGDAGLATARLREGLAVRRALGQRPGIAEGLEGLATLAAGTGQPDRAARLLGAAEALREAIGAPLAPVDRPGRDAAIAAARAALGDDGFAAALAAGQALTLDAAAEAVLADDGEGLGAGQAM